ncbi:MAG: putative toxin-antitoxin system toxin component, PIN family [Elusimicrobia bacterium]|nr:putative toxin-antitoxin system toxin component, PIN family [Elusimicrobiota bacterium]
MKVVLDTNVLVSGFLNPYGPPGSIVGFAASGNLALCYDARILAEYREVLLRPRFELDAQAVDDFLAQVESEGEPVTAAPLPQHLPDRSDEPFLEAALGGRAECLVTGNRDHFPARLCLGMRVLSPAELVDAFRKRP